MWKTQLTYVLIVNWARFQYRFSHPAAPSFVSFVLDDYEMLFRVRFFEGTLYHFWIWFSAHDLAQSEDLTLWLGLVPVLAFWKVLKYIYDSMGNKSMYTWTKDLLVGNDLQLFTVTFNKKYFNGWVSSQRL